MLSIDRPRKESNDQNEAKEQNHAVKMIAIIIIDYTYTSFNLFIKIFTRIRSVRVWLGETADKKLYKKTLLRCCCNVPRRWVERK